MDVAVVNLDSNLFKAGFAIIDQWRHYTKK